MTREFYAQAHALAERGETFVTAVVVRAEGSASARTGSKAILRPDGSKLCGWVGGGCVDAAVGEEAIAALNEGAPRLFHVDLNSEVTGVGMPCGGAMDIYVEPHLPKPQLLLFGHGPIVETLARLGSQLGFVVTVDDATATRELYPTADLLLNQDPGLDRFKVTPATSIAIATQHKSDDFVLEHTLGRGAAYIALVASKKRAELVFRTLIERGVPAARLAEVRAPAGLDLGAQTPEEIALAILSEIVAVRRGGSGRPLIQIKGPTVAGVTAAPAAAAARSERGTEA
ncbi:MAG: XdhC family protein [Planctomycetes bacterium]|nr:XdhC family protein [Planctomycetota bacterium]